MLQRIKAGFADQKTASKIIFILFSTIVFSITFVILIVCTVCSNMIISKTNALMESRMNMSQKSLEEYFSTYENMIMGIYVSNQYTDDLERLNLMDMHHYFSIRHRVEESLQNDAYLYPGILGIRLCSQKLSIYYDSLSGIENSSACFSDENEQWKELVQKARSHTQMLYASDCKIGPEEQYNVVYVGHRLVDLNNYAKGTLGSIIICIDEKDIRSVYSQGNEETQLSYLCDSNGYIVSCPDESLIGRCIVPEGETLSDVNIMNFVGKAVSEYKMLDTSRFLIYVRPICEGEFYQICIQDKDELLKELKYVVIMIILIGMITILIGGIITIHFADSIGEKMKKIIVAMDKVQEGDYSVQIENEYHDEFGKISRQFNYMVRQIEDSVNQEKNALIREKNAEIKALEAQINPHFLYNTLDAINWIAIENEQFKISKMLKDLAIILRYSIQQSNSVVRLEDEIEYLKKYILLQQQRFDFSFKCFLDIEEEVKYCKIHKLLFQPLVENAIVHGFPGTTGEDTIWIQVRREGKDRLRIVIRDNGKGMEEGLVHELNHFDYRHDSVKNSIGIRNVFMRVKYYYGEKADFSVVSDNEGTEITLLILFQQ